LHAILHGAGGEHEMIVYGIIVVVIMIFMPEGLSAGLPKALRRARQRAVQKPSRVGAATSDSGGVSAN